MEVNSTSFGNNETIPGHLAFCVPAQEGHVAMSDNKNPHLSWSNFPEGTKSFAVICHDPDVPSVGDNVNQEGKTVSKDLPRVDFFHWVLVDIPTSVTEIPEGAASSGITARGKEPGPTDYGVQGANCYTGWFASDEDMKGNYGGYDGPCPPWNDEIIHHYHFTVYALDVESVGLSGPFMGPDARKAIESHVLDQASWVGTYTLNPDLI